jgi:hypothetical protein
MEQEPGRRWSKLSGVIAAIWCCVAVGTAGAAPPVDDRSAIFWAQAQRITELGEPAEGLVRCGIRSPQWAAAVQFSIVLGVGKLSDRLWPDTWKGDMGEGSPSDIRGQALEKAYRAQDEASERGRHVTPQWCAETGGRLAPILDEFARP